MHQKIVHRTILSGWAFMALAQPAAAIDKVYEPYVTKGEAEIEYSGIRSSDSDKSKNNQQSHEIEFGYGLTNYWELEFAGNLERSSGSPTQLEDLEIENKFQLYEAGEMWMDAGLLLSYAHANHRDNPDSLEAKILLQKDIYKFSSLMNIGFEQGLGDENHGGPDVSIQWNNRYRLNSYFQPGIEIQSDFGQTNLHNSFNEQEHFIGPSSYGKLYGNGLGDLGYEAAYLFGVSDAAPHNAARIMLEYEMRF